MEEKRPNYKKIYLDLVRKKFPEKEALLDSFLEKESISRLDVIEINDKIFNKPHNQEVNQRLRSYTESDIKSILTFQKDYDLKNVELAHHFNLSRNTVTKWKRIFGKEIS